MDNFLRRCETCLDDIVFEELTPEVLAFSSKKTIAIPPMAEYRNESRRLHYPLHRLTENDKSAAKGFETENLVRNFFGNFAPGGVYLSRLKILSLVGNNFRLLKTIFPDVVAIHEFLKNYADLEIDGLFLHRKIGIAAIEAKSFKYFMKSTEEKAAEELSQKKKKKKEAPEQLNRIQQFVSGLYHTIFGEPICIPVLKVICAPNVIEVQNGVADGIELLGKQEFSETDGVHFEIFWRRKMTLEKRKAVNFRKFAAVLISMKTSFGFVDHFTSTIIKKTHNMINGQASYGGSQTQQMNQGNKGVAFCFNNEQLSVLNATPGQHFLNGVPGSGKTLLLKARLLTFLSDSERGSDRKAQIFCPKVLTFHYQEFVNDNDLKDRVKVSGFSELSKIADLFNEEPNKFANSQYADFLWDTVDIYCDEMNFETLTKPLLYPLLEARPEAGAETFVVGESPEIAKNVVEFTFKIAAKKFSTQYLKVMMRNSKEIMSYYKTNHDPYVLLGHSISACNVMIKECKNRREQKKEIVSSVHFLLGKSYRLHELAIIIINRQKKEIEFALHLSKIAFKNLKHKKSHSEAVSVLSPMDAKSYEWRAVVICLDYDHEGELALAVSRAISELIIVKDMAYERTIKELKENQNGSPEEILMKWASSEKDLESLQKNCHAFPNIADEEHKDWKDVNEYRNWNIYDTLQKCDYSSENLLLFRERVKYELSDGLNRKISKLHENSEDIKNVHANGTFRRSKRGRGSTRSLQEGSGVFTNKSFESVESKSNPVMRRYSYSSSASGASATEHNVTQSKADSSKISAATSNRGFESSNMMYKNPRIPIHDDAYIQDQKRATGKNLPTLTVETEFSATQAVNNIPSPPKSSPTTFRRIVSTPTFAPIPEEKENEYRLSSKLKVGEASKASADNRAKVDLDNPHDINNYNNFAHAHNQQYFFKEKEKQYRTSIVHNGIHGDSLSTEFLRQRSSSQTLSQSHKPTGLRHSTTELNTKSQPDLPASENYFRSEQQMSSAEEFVVRPRSFTTTSQDQANFALSPTTTANSVSSSVPNFITEGLAQPSIPAKMESGRPRFTTNSFDENRVLPSKTDFARHPTAAKTNGVSELRTLYQTKMPAVPSTQVNGNADPRRRSWPKNSTDQKHYLLEKSDFTGSSTSASNNRSSLVSDHRKVAPAASSVHLAQVNAEPRRRQATNSADQHPIASGKTSTFIGETKPYTSSSYTTQRDEVPIGSIFARLEQLKNAGLVAADSISVSPRKQPLQK